MKIGTQSLVNIIVVKVGVKEEMPATSPMILLHVVNILLRGWKIRCRFLHVFHVNIPGRKGILLSDM